MYALVSNESEETVSALSSTKTISEYVKVRSMVGMRFVMVNSAGVMDMAEKMGDSEDPWPRPTLHSTSLVRRPYHLNLVHLLQR